METHFAIEIIYCAIPCAACPIELDCAKGSVAENAASADHLRIRNRDR
jgi:hypothetical protein